MWRDQQSLIAWTVRQANRPRFARSWERFVLALFRACSSPALRLVGGGFAWVLARNEEDEDEVDDFNEWAFGADELG